MPSHSGPKQATPFGIKIFPVCFSLLFSRTIPPSPLLDKRLELGLPATIRSELRRLKITGVFFFIFLSVLLLTCSLPFYSSFVLSFTPYSGPGPFLITQAFPSFILLVSILHYFLIFIFVIFVIESSTNIDTHGNHPLFTSTHGRHSGTDDIHMDLAGCTSPSNDY